MKLRLAFIPVLALSLFPSGESWLGRTCSAQETTTALYRCPMHGEVSSGSPGTCPKCGMKLVANSSNSESNNKSDSSESGSVGSSKGGVIPDIPVLDQDGRTLHFYSDLVKGKTVAINFIFTTCTTICPPVTATFRRVQQELGKVGTDATLISISVDPNTDVPARLKSFATRFDARPGWTFVTGTKPEIDKLLRSLSAYVPDKIDHTPLVLVINDNAGYWTRSYGLAPAGALVKVIAEAATRRP